MNLTCFSNKLSDKLIPIIPLNIASLKIWINEKATHSVQEYIAGLNFTAKSQTYINLFNSNGKIDKILIGVDGELSIWALSRLYQELPEAAYILQDDYEILDHQLAYTGFALGAYQFDKYKIMKKRNVILYLPEKYSQVAKTVESVYLVRDLINTPAEDMAPQHLSIQVQQLAKQYSADFSEIIGDELLKQNYPTIHAVGRASINLPRLLDLRWGDKVHPKLTLVGKGVCFDTGGLDIKPPAGMLIMHKDMGGSAHVIGLAKLIMANKLPVRLRLLIPAVENSVSENAYRPSDVIKTRSGKTVQVLNTDAEGRLVLCDALTEADSENPDMIIDMATLTGASRVALGAEVPSYFINNQNHVEKLSESSATTEDPIWQMPLYQPYKKYLENNIADMGNVAIGYPYGGAIIAALFLESFIEPDTDWMHVDLGAWNFNDRPGRPKEGECMGLRAIYQFLENKYKS